MLFADNIQWHIYRMHMYTALCKSHPLLPITPSLFTLVNLILYLLGEPAFLARATNTHPLLSLVCYQLLTPCCITHPKAPHKSSYIFTLMPLTTSAVSSDTWSNGCLQGSQVLLIDRLSMDDLRVLRPGWWVADGPHGSWPSTVYKWEMTGWPSDRRTGSREGVER